MLVWWWCCSSMSWRLLHWQTAQTREGTGGHGEEVTNLRCHWDKMQTDPILSFLKDKMDQTRVKYREYLEKCSTLESLEKCPLISSNSKLEYFLFICRAYERCHIEFLIQLYLKFVLKGQKDFWEESHRIKVRAGFGTHLDYTHPPPWGSWHH